MRQLHDTLLEIHALCQFAAVQCRLQEGQQIASDASYLDSLYLVF